MRNRIRLLLADPHRVYCSELAEILEATPELLVVGRATTVADLHRLALEQSPDLILLDLDLPGGLAAAQALISRDPAIGLVIHTVSNLAEDYAAAQRAGACAYILKGTGARTLVQRLLALKPARLLYTVEQN